MSSVFSKILQRELPGHFVWEDDRCFAIMTIQPIREGHLIVIPREKIDHWDEIPPDLAAHLFQVSQFIAKGIKEVVPCKRIGMSIIGLEVPHAHLHLIPIDTIGDMNFGLAHAVPAESLAHMADRIRGVLRRHGHAAADVPQN